MFIRYINYKETFTFHAILRNKTLFLFELLSKNNSKTRIEYTAHLTTMSNNYQIYQNGLQMS